jgi:hypothetical protein
MLLILCLDFCYACFLLKTVMHEVVALMMLGYKLEPYESMKFGGL